MSRSVSMRSKMVPADYFVEVARGKVLNSKLVGVTTSNDSIGNDWTLVGGVSDVTNLSDIIPTTASVLKLSSTSDDDRLASTGAHQIYIDGLDANFEFVFDIVDLDGWTEVSTVNIYIRTNSFIILDSNLANAKGIAISEGDIHAGFGTVNAAGVNSNPMQIIQQGWRQGLTSCVTVPNGYLGIINYIMMTGNISATGLEFRIIVNFFDSIGLTETPSLHPSDGVFYWKPIPPVAFPPKTDIIFVAKNGNAGSSITAETLFDLSKIIA